MALITLDCTSQIIALNCLVSAYALSVLYLDGVKYGDSQATTQVCSSNDHGRRTRPPQWPFWEEYVEPPGCCRGLLSRQRSSSFPAPSRWRSFLRSGHTVHSSPQESGSPLVRVYC